MTISMKKLVGTSLLTMAFAQCSNAWAQDTADVNDDVANGEAEIIVTAQFREQNVQDIPLAISAVSGEALEARGQTALVDIGSSIPSVNISNATSINGNAVSAFIRGIGQDDSNFALEPGVGIYVDDVYYGTTFGASIDLVDLERAEVLRGPQGTLAGKNSLGGAIKLYSRKPDEDLGGFVQAGYGRFDRIDARASVNLPLAAGLYARLSAAYRKDDGYFRELDFGCANPGQGLAATPGVGGDCVIGRAGGANILTLRAALRYAPDSSPLEINVIGDYTRDRAQPAATKLIFANNPNSRTYDASGPFAGVPFDSRFITAANSYTSYANYGDGANATTIFAFPTQVVPGTFPDGRQNSATGWGVSGTADLELSDSLALKSITSYRKADGNTVVDVDGSPVNILKENLGGLHKQFSQELRLSGKVGDAFDFTVGGYYYKANDRLDQRIQIPAFLFDFQTRDPVSNRSIAAFGHFEWHATERLNVLGGIRYTEDKKSYTFSRRNADGSAISGIPPTLNFTVAGLDGLVGNFQDTRVDYRLGVNYAWNDRILTYLQVATGYKGGGINPRPFVFDQVLPFGPEKLTTYEGGFKASFVGGDVVFNGSAFYNEYGDIQRTIFNCTGISFLPTCSLPINAGKGHSYGFELETFLRPADGWKINASLSLLDFAYDAINPATFIPLNADAPFLNKIQASLGVQYRADLGDAGSLTPRLDVASQSEFEYNPVNTPFSQIPARTLVNARLTYETASTGWEVTGSVSNLFDKYYFVGSSENIGNFGLASFTVGRPREWLLSLKKTF